MLLTITYTGENSTDLGYLLHKNPNRPQAFALNHGTAYVFYPTATEEKTTVALLLKIDPIELARGKVGSASRGLFDYVNDRPYVASSFLSTALARVFGTAMTGKCDKLPDLANTSLELEAKLVMLPCSNVDILERIFQPLGYEVEYTTYLSDELFPEWGMSKYIDLTIHGKVRLCDLLNHLYVLIPVFDMQKHYWVGKDEIDKLLGHGEGWLANHPEAKLITSKYLKRQKNLVNQAFDRLFEKEIVEEQAESIPTSIQVSLNKQRLQSVMNEVNTCGAKTVIDIGCGEGKLIKLLMKEKELVKVTGVDVSNEVLEKAKGKLRMDEMSDYQKNKLTIFQGSLTYRDNRFEGYDVACIVEVIEHLDIPRLTAFERVLFEFARPRTAIITTPNVEYNRHYETLLTGSFRHSDHRFEWTRQEFESWAEQLCEKYNYVVRFLGIGSHEESTGSPTQMGVFIRCE